MQQKILPLRIKFVVVFTHIDGFFWGEGVVGVELSFSHFQPSAAVYCRIFFKIFLPAFGQQKNTPQSS